MKKAIVTPEFLRSAYELAEEDVSEVLKAIRLLLAEHGDASLHIDRPGGSSDDVQSIKAGNHCRILFSAGQDVKLLFAGVNSAARRFTKSGHADATAFAEAPIAFQLHIDFWQTGPFAATESPSCGATISADSLDELIVRGRKYLPLAKLLLSRGPEVESIELGFREIETALGDALPMSAHTQPVWWANDVSHPQATAWLSIGWQATALDLQKKTIVFVRTVREGFA